MPLTVFNQLGLGEPRPTTVTLLFADRSTSQPTGIIENVLVKVDKFIFPTDFIVLDCDVDWNIPLIFGRPFLATARTLIDVEKGKITLRVDDEKMIINMPQALNFHDDSANCSFVDILDSIGQQHSSASMIKDPLEAVLIREKSFAEVDEKAKEVFRLDSLPHSKSQTVEPLEEFDVLKPSIEAHPLKNTINQFGIPREIISDCGSHFYNHESHALMKKYGVEHKIALPYHPQPNGHVESANQKIKKTLEKVVCTTRKVNVNSQAVGEKKLLQLNELEEFRLNADESSKLSKGKIKRGHDKKTIPKSCGPGQQVLHHNSKLRLFPERLKSRWPGPVKVVQAYSCGDGELEYDKRERFKANGHRLKHYWGEDADKMVSTIHFADEE